jgi:uncharacterized membrane protein YqjE
MDDENRVDSSQGAASSLLGSLKRMFATLIELAGTRLELATTELEEERVRLQEIAIYGVIAAFLISIGILFATFLVIVIFWDTHRLEVVGICAAVYLVLGIASALVVRSKLRSKPKAFSTTIAELQKDKDNLLG